MEKSEVINISKKNLAFAEKYGRQIFAKIPVSLSMTWIGQEIKSIFRQ